MRSAMCPNLVSPHKWKQKTLGSKHDRGAVILLIIENFKHTSSPKGDSQCQLVTALVSFLQSYQSSITEPPQPGTKT